MSVGQIWFKFEKQKNKDVKTCDVHKINRIFEKSLSSQIPQSKRCARDVTVQKSGEENNATLAL